MGKPVLLITGGSGQVGHEVAKLASGFGFRAVAPGRDALDLARPGTLREAVAALKPALVVNCAAWTAVDAAEKNRDAAFAVNADGVKNLAASCADPGVPLIHLSTDYVFDGQKADAYVETDTPDPQSVYGQSKLAGEEAIRATLSSHIILRTAWVYGEHGSNFIKTMLRLAQTRETVNVVADQYGGPTASTDIAFAVLSIARAVRDGRSDAFGTYHYTGAGTASWAGFAEAVFSAAGAATTVNPITTAEYPTDAPRPANSRLDCAKITEAFGLQPEPWERRVRIITRNIARRENSP